MKRAVFFCILCFTMGFWVGTLKGRVTTITLETTKEVKVYDFTQEPRVMELYANAVGKTLMSLEEKEAFGAGRYVEGYRTAIERWVK